MNPTEVSLTVERTKRLIRLKWHEEQIESKGKAFRIALCELRGDPLKPYLATHSSLGDYLEDRWSMTERRQQQLLAAQNVRDQLSIEAPDIAPVVEKMNEGQVRELVSAPKNKRLEILRAAVAEPRGKITASSIKQIRVKIIEPETPPDPDAHIKLFLEFRPSEWLRIVDALHSPELIRLGAVVHGAAERAGITKKQETDIL